MQNNIKPTTGTSTPKGTDCDSNADKATKTPIAQTTMKKNKFKRVGSPLRVEED